MNKGNSTTGGLGEVIKIDGGQVKEHLGEMVRGTVEETLNAMLDHKADQLCRAQRYERSQKRRDYRSGSYQRSLQAKAGPVTLKVFSVSLNGTESRTKLRDTSEVI